MKVTVCSREEIEQADSDGKRCSVYVFVGQTLDCFYSRTDRIQLSANQADLIKSTS